MTPARTLVAALDLSACSERALVRAATFAARSSARLHLVHVAAQRLGSEQLPDSEVDAIRGRLERFVTDALGVSSDGPLLAHGTVLAVVRGASVSDAVLRYASRVGADLLVVGTRGRAGLDRLLVGGVAEACVTRAAIPVLTVPRGAESHEPSATAPVLAAIDLSPRSRAVLREARRQAEIFEAPLEIVHVVRDLGPYSGLVPSALSLRDRDPERAAVVEHRLARFVGEPAVGTLHVALGAPSRLVAAVAAARRAGVLVMGTNGRSGVVHALLGSTAYATIQRAGCAVLTVGEDTSRAPRPTDARIAAAALPSPGPAPVAS